MDWTKFLTAEANELNMIKAIFEYGLLQIDSLYTMTDPLLWFQKINADEKERLKPIPILVEVKLP